MNEYGFKDAAVEHVFRAYQRDIREALLMLRQAIFVIAAEHNEVGGLEETLKWDSPSYVTKRPQSGTTIRLAPLKSHSEEFAISVHCQSTLISDFKEVYPELRYDGNRSIIFNVNETIPLKTVEHFIYLALSYHYRKKHDIGI
ncbi:MAG: DUF1801 domain-containing protein [Arenicella sp.]